ncbi:hypothetical protein [Meridianimarinicoccus sp. MJW13]|nr:hypothetical protein [Fluviibacterium sp. MJW13]
MNNLVTISALMALVVAVALLSRATQQRGYTAFARGAGVPIFFQMNSSD